MSLKLKMKTKLQIIRSEGFSTEDSSLGCYVLVNHELIDVITPLKSSDPTSTEIPSTMIPTAGNLQLLVKKMNGDSIYLGSLSVLIESLPSKGFLWLGLSQDAENDFQNPIKEQKSPLKLLISVEKPTTHINSSTLYQLQIKKFEFLTNQLEDRLQETSNLYENEKKARSSLASAYETLQRQFEEVLAKSGQRENLLLALIEKKDKELQESFFKFKDLRSRYESVKMEKNQLSEQVEFLKTNSSIGVVEKYSAELQELKRNVQELREKDRKRNKEVEIMGKDWISAVRSFAVCDKVSEMDVQNIEKVEEFRLKAQILELNEKNLSLVEKVRKLEGERNDLNLKLIESNQIGKTSQKENRSSEIQAIKLFKN